MLDDWVEVYELALMERLGAGQRDIIIHRCMHTLVSYPLALFDSLGAGAQGHKVALDNVLGACSV